MADHRSQEEKALAGFRAGKTSWENIPDPAARTARAKRAADTTRKRREAKIVAEAGGGMTIEEARLRLAHLRTAREAVEAAQAAQAAEAAWVEAGRP